MSKALIFGISDMDILRYFILALLGLLMHTNRNLSKM